MYTMKSGKSFGMYIQVYNELKTFQRVFLMNQSPLEART